MSNLNTSYIQEYNHQLSNKFKELNETYSTLKNDTRKLYDENINNKLHEKKLNYYVDTVALDIDGENYFRSYETEKEVAIKNLLQNDYYLNQDNILKTFNIRKKILNKRIEQLNMDNIGTTLNVLREFYNDIHLDVKRNKKRELVSYYLNGNGEYVLDLGNVENRAGNEINKMDIEFD